MNEKRERRIARGVVLSVQLLLTTPDLLHASRCTQQLAVGQKSKNKRRRSSSSGSGGGGGGREEGRRAKKKSESIPPSRSALSPVSST